MKTLNRERARIFLRVAGYKNVREINLAETLKVACEEYDAEYWDFFEE